MNIVKSAIETLSAPFRRRTENLLEHYPYLEPLEGVMFTDTGFHLFGLEVEVPSTALSADTGRFTESFHYLLRNVLPEPSRMRVVLETSPVSFDEIQTYKDRINAEEPDLKTLLNVRAKALEEDWRQGDVRANRAFVIVRLGGKAAVRTKQDVQRRIQQAHKLRDEVSSVFARIGFKNAAMGNRDIRDLCLRFNNPDLKDVDYGDYHSNPHHYPQRLVKETEGARAPTFRAQVLKSSIDNDGLGMFPIGESYCRIIAMNTSPARQTFKGMIHATEAAGKDYMVVLDFYSELAEKIYARIADRDKWYQVSTETPFYTDKETLVLAQQTGDALEHVQASGDKFINVSCSIVLFDKNPEELERRTQRTYSHLAKIPGNPFIILKSGATQPFFELSPFTGKESVLKVTMTCTNAAHLLPIAGMWKGLGEGIFLRNRWCGLTKINPFADVSGGYNGVVVGATGSGKSFGLQFILGEFLAEADNSVIVLDRGSGYKHLVAAAEGSYINVAHESINIFDLLPGQDKPELEDIDDIRTILRSMVPGEGGEKEDIEDALIAEAIRGVYSFSRRELRGQVTFYTPTLSDFVKRLGIVTELQGRLLNTNHMQWRDSLVHRFALWTGETPEAAFIDRQTTLELSNPRMIYFDLAGIIANKKLSIPGVLIVQNLVKKHIKRNQGRRTLIALDEAWDIIKNSPSGKAFVTMMYRTFRKLGAGVFSVSQSIDDFPQEILTNSRMFFGFASPDEERIRWMERYNLPQDAWASLSQVTSEANVFSEAMAIFRDGDGRYIGNIVVIRPTELDLILSTSDPNHLPIIQAASEEHGSPINAYLKGELSVAA